MDFFELLRNGSSEDIANNIASTRRSTQNVVLAALSPKTIKAFKKSWMSCAFNGTPHKRKVGDLRGHHLTQKGPALEYTLPTRSAVRHRASKHLHEKRWKMVELFERRSRKGKISKSIPLPREVIDKQVAVPRQLREKFKHTLSPLSTEAAMNKPESGLVTEVERTIEDTSEEMEGEAETRKPKAALFTSIDEVEEFRKRLSDIDSGKIPKDDTKIAEANKRWEAAMSWTEHSDKTRKSSQEKAVRFAAPVVTDFRYYKAEDDESEEDESEEDESEEEESEEEDESEEDESEEDESEEDESDTDLVIEDPDDIETDDEEFEDVLEGDPPTLHLRDLPISNPVSEGKPERQKRKREFEDSSDPPTLEDVERNEKRKQQKTVSSSSWVPTARRWTSVGPYREGKTAIHDFFCRSSSLAAVFQLAIEIGVTEMAQANNANSALEVLEDEIETPQVDSKLDDTDLMLLGEMPSDPDQAQPSLVEDLEEFIGGTLWPGVSHMEIRIASAGAKLLGSSDFLEPDRKALREAFSHSDEL